MLAPATYALLIPALYCDLRTRRVPNAITLPAIALALALQATLNGTEGLIEALQGGGLGLILLLPLFAAGKFGGGDVKLLVAIGALRGASFLWRAALLGAMAGGVLAFGLLAYHRELGYVALGVMSKGSYRTERTYPYSPAIALGVLLADLGWLL